MSMPGLVAETSLYRTSNCYYTARMPDAGNDEEVLSQWWPRCHWDPYTHQLICCHWTYWHGWVCEPVPGLV